MRALLAAAFCLVLASAAQAQVPGGGVNQSGAVTANHCTKWKAPGQIQDAGAPCGTSTAVGANPTATIGAAAVNGTSPNFLRADGAPALPATLPALNGSLLTNLSGGNITAGSVANAALANPATTVNGQTCTLGSTCTVGAAAGTLTGTTLAAGVTASSLLSAGGGSFTTAAFTTIGTSGATIPLLNGANTWSAGQTFSASLAYTATAATGTRWMLVSGSTVAQNYFDITNTGAWFRAGVENSAGGAVISGSKAYASVIGTETATSLQLGANDAIYLTLDSGGATTLSGGTVFLTNIGADTGLADATLCRVVAGGSIKSGTGAAGLCLGTSSRRFKTYIADLTPGLAAVLALRPRSFYLDAAHGDPKKQLYGFIAEEMLPVLPKLVGRDVKGLPNTADYVGVIPVLVKAVQEQQKEIASLRAALASRKR